MHGQPTYGKTFKATLRILFSAGNLLYVLASSILLLLAILPFLTRLTNYQHPSLPEETVITQALILLSVFILAGKTCDNMARIHAGLGDTPIPATFTSIISNKTALLYATCFVALAYLTDLAETALNHVGLGSITSYLQDAVLLILVPAMTLNYLRCPTPLAFFNPVSIARAISSIGIHRYLCITLITILMLLLGPLFFSVLLSIFLTILLTFAATIPGAAEHLPLYTDLTIILLLICSKLLLTFGLTYMAWYYPHTVDDDNESTYTPTPESITPDRILPLALQAMKAERYQRVLELTRNFAKNHPNHPHLVENYYLAALALAKTGAVDKALPLLQQLHTRYPDHPRAATIEQAIARLQGSRQT